MTASVALRPLTAADEPLLAHATLDNLNWSEQRFTEFDLRSRSEFRHYTRLILDRGDFGFVAEHIGEAIGVGWALFLPAGDPGYGFVDESTPEISLWVQQQWRGQGVGKRLLRRLQQEAVSRGIARLSLSVEADNHAKWLYEHEGFVQLSGGDQAGIMVWAS